MIKQSELFANVGDTKVKAKMLLDTVSGLIQNNIDSLIEDKQIFCLNQLEESKDLAVLSIKEIRQELYNLSVSISSFYLEKKEEYKDKLPETVDFQI